MKRIFLVLTSVILLSGCMSKPSYRSGDGSLYGDPLEGEVEIGSSTDQVQTDRMLIWEGSITLDVIGVAETQKKVTQYAKEAGGYVESTSQRRYGDMPSVSLTLRIPAEKLRQVVGSLESVGEVTEKRISSEDITENYIDTQARLETKIKLRDRLQALLEKATDVKDILAIEKELTRLQGDIDSMTARLKSMKGKVDYASLEVTLNAQRQEKVLGPLGYVWERAKWIVRKLFVWKEESYANPEPVARNADAAPNYPMIVERVFHPGDTLDSIAIEYGVSTSEIRRLNQIEEGEEARVGQRLRIPVVD